MRKISLLFLFLIVICHSSYSQNLEGTVFDNETGKPIPFASVYLNGTSIYATTDDYGRFHLNIERMINTDLIISHVGYDIISISNPFQTSLNKIFLTEKKNILKEVVIVPQKQDRKKLLKQFKNYFLGTTKGGKSCKILNEDKINLYYNSEDRVLTASCDTAIIIENKHLGYRISFNLMDYYVQFNKPMRIQMSGISSGSGSGDASANNGVKVAYFIGTSSFLDLEPNNKKIRKRREEIFKYSMAHFFKSFVNRQLKEDGYKISSIEGNIVEVDSCFTLSDTLEYKKVSVIPDTRITQIDSISIRDIPVEAWLYIHYKKDNYSRLLFLTNSFLVDQYGNDNAAGKLFFSGYLGKQRMGDMLPLDYGLWVF